MQKKQIGQGSISELPNLLRQDFEGLKDRGLLIFLPDGENKCYVHVKTREREIIRMITTNFSLAGSRQMPELMNYCHAAGAGVLLNTSMAPPWCRWRAQQRVHRSLDSIFRTHPQFTVGKALIPYAHVFLVAVRLVRPISLAAEQVIMMIP